MTFELKWRKHQADKNCIEGICDWLPDQFCRFVIKKNSHGKFWVMLPTFSTENFTKQIILRDPNVAREFCHDFLNYNIKTILQNQIHEMSRRSVKGDKPQSYYQSMLNKLTNESPIPLKPFRKAS